MNLITKQCKQCTIDFTSPLSHHRTFCSIRCCHASRKKYTNPNGRTCLMCKTWKELTEFRICQKFYTHPYCRSCDAKRAREASVKPHVRFGYSKSLAKKRKRQWGLTEEEYIALIVNPCYYCGNNLPKTGVGLDRKDNALGYVSENVVPCCEICNAVKNHYFTFLEMEQFLAPALKAIRKERTI